MEKSRQLVQRLGASLTKTVATPNALAYRSRQRSHPLGLSPCFGTGASDSANRPSAHMVLGIPYLPRSFLMPLHTGMHLHVHTREEGWPLFASPLLAFTGNRNSFACKRIFSNSPLPSAPLIVLPPSSGLRVSLPLLVEPPSRLHRDTGRAGPAKHTTSLHHQPLPVH